MEHIITDHFNIVNVIKTHVPLTNFDPCDERFEILMMTDLIYSELYSQ